MEVPRIHATMKAHGMEIDAGEDHEAVNRRRCFWVWYCGTLSLGRPSTYLGCRKVMNLRDSILLTATATACAVAYCVIKLEHVDLLSYPALVAPRDHCTCGPLGEPGGCRGASQTLREHHEVRSSCVDRVSNASTMEQQARDKKLQRPALWDWTSIESPADSQVVIENGEDSTMPSCAWRTRKASPPACERFFRGR